MKFNQIQTGELATLLSGTHKKETLKVMLRKTIRNDDFERNTV